MCGIVAVLASSAERPAAALSRCREEVVATAAELVDALGAVVADGVVGTTLAETASHAKALNRRLRTQEAVVAFVRDPPATERLRSSAHRFAAQVELVDELVSSASAAQVTDVEAVSTLADASFELVNDRLAQLDEVNSVARGPLQPAAIAGWWAISVALAAIDRLEVRGRDSAGLQVFVPAPPEHLARLKGDVKRLGRDGRLFGAGDVVLSAAGAAFVYKVAAEIGELGDNTASLRRQIADDHLLRDALAALADDEQVSPPVVAVLGHTRWASVGIISEPNAHPIATQTSNASGHCHIAAVVNGDIDNHAELSDEHDLVLPPAITTDARVVPTLLCDALGERTDTSLERAFTRTVATLDGSLAIAVHAAAHPTAVALALRGSGQAMYLGSTDFGWLAASEPYGLVAECDSYVRMDGETAADPTNPVGSRGQVVVVDSASIDTASERFAHIGRFSYDGSAQPVAPAEVIAAEITTRDIDRGDARHFFAKEIREAPASFRATLRGRISGTSERPRVELGDGALPPDVIERLRAGEIDKIIGIGQGTAAAAAATLGAFVDHLARQLRGQPPETKTSKTTSPLAHLSATSCLATELSGFGLVDDMSDTLVVAVSQSGTTTDTNRTVDLVRDRGASVIAVVNRRGSDLTHKADGVLYTSDGRDVEMSVASTKAYYSQVAACALLAAAIVDELTEARDERASERAAAPVADLLRALSAVPAAMERLLVSHPDIAAVARRHIGPKRHWAVVGNGFNALAAREVRIKLSELCYHAVAQDATENKKHIDLSSEPLVLVCAAGLSGSVLADVAKEVAIYRAHAATPVVIASPAAHSFGGADTIVVPRVHPAVDFVLATMAGHLFAYEAALAIDSLATPLRATRAALEELLAQQRVEPEPLPEHAATLSDTDDLHELATAVGVPLADVTPRLLRGDYDGHLRPATALRLATVARYATSVTPLDAYQVELGVVGTPAVVIEELAGALNDAIDELGRPIDAIKHQAKSVTVGISRAEETLTKSVLVAEVLAAGARVDSLSYRALGTLSALDVAVDEVTGFTRYRVDGEVTSDGAGATITVVGSGGVAAAIPSRTVDDPTLAGTKHRAAFEQEVTVGVGRDERTVIHVPETSGGRTVGITLLHCSFKRTLAAETARGVLRGYRGRYGALRDAVTEIVPTFDDDLLGEIEFIDLLTKPVHALAERWLVQ